MAAKATIQDITDAGFRAEQFGTPADFDTPETGYIARILARASVWASSVFGAGYAAITATTDPATFERLRSAELCWARSELWKRRAAFIDSNAVSALENLSHSDRREFEQQAARAWECAQDAMAEAIGDPNRERGTAAVLTHVETGAFVAGWPVRAWR